MPILALIDGGPPSPVLLDALREDARGFFWIYSRKDEELGIAVEFPYGFRPKYNCSDTEVLLLLSPFQVEAAVMEVRLHPGADRLGYIFPAIAAGSPNHKFSSDRFFHTACFAATYQSLRKVVVVEPDLVDVGRCPASCGIADVLKGELVILTAHMPSVIEAGISLDQLSVDLHRYGYVHADWSSPDSPMRLEVVRANFDAANLEGRLRLRALSKELTSDSLIKKFLARRISCPDDPVLRFFYLYQVVERILELELRNYSDVLRRELSAIDLLGPRISSAFHELKEAFSDKARLSKLFGARTKCALQSSPTNGYFEAFLKGCKVEIEESDSYWENLYKVRNIVFHAWWSIPNSLSAEFSKLVAGIENDIPELLLSYTPLPTSSADLSAGDYSI